MDVRHHGCTLASYPTQSMPQSTKGVPRKRRIAAGTSLVVLRSMTSQPIRDAYVYVSILSDTAPSLRLIYAWALAHRGQSAWVDVANEHARGTQHEA
jgi:hypothetical protein